MESLDDSALSLAVFVPLVVAAAMLLVPRENETAHKLMALGATLATFAVGMLILARFDYGASDRLQFRVDAPWIDVINSRYLLGVDGISLPLLVLSMFVCVLVVVYSWNHFPEPIRVQALSRGRCANPDDLHPSVSRRLRCRETGLRRGRLREVS